METPSANLPTTAIPAQRPPSVQMVCRTIPRGDGSFVVIPGKPVSRLTPDQFGNAIGVSAMTVRRWIRDGTIRKKFVTSRGKVGYWVAAEAVKIVRQELTARKLSQ